MAKNKNKNKNKRKNKIKSKKKRLDINKLKTVADAPLIESSSKNKSQYDRISLITTPAQKMELKRVNLKIARLANLSLLDLSSKFLH